MSYHQDPEVNQALIRLLGALCRHERNTGQRNTLIFVPHDSDQPGVIAQDGKPLQSDKDVSLILDLALRERYRI